MSMIIVIKCDNCRDWNEHHRDLDDDREQCTFKLFSEAVAHADEYPDHDMTIVIEEEIDDLGEWRYR